MATIGERIDSINRKFDREIDTLQRDRDREIAAVLAEMGIGVPSVNQPKRPGPKPGRRRMKKRITQKAAPQSSGATNRGGGSRKRLTKNKKAALVDKALDLFNAKPGQKFSRGEIAGKLKVKPTQVQTILKEIKGLKSEGKKASTVYFVA